MATYTCPNGHHTEADDYCDVCGSPVDTSTAAADAAGQPAAAGDPAAAAGASGASAGAAGSGASAGGGAGAQGAAGAGQQICDNCQTPNPAGALFCEACGYDFTTGAMPRTSDPWLAASQALKPPAADPGLDPEVDPAGATDPAAAASAPPEPADPAPASPAPAAAAGPAASSDPGWVVEVWVDPDWFATQDSPDPCPSPGLPLVIALGKRSALIGRPSSSRNIAPDVDLSSDPGVSRRHAELTSDGKRWFIEDLGSSNGTFVAPASGPVPTTPIPAGPKKELSDDDRVYLGAWTRLVVRPATPGEIESLT